MIEELVNNAVLVAAVLSPITVGIIQVFKKTLKIDTRFLPLLSLLVGLVVALSIAVGTSQDIAQFVLIGIVGGLSASGLYDQTKIGEEQDD